MTTLYEMDKKFLHKSISQLHEIQRPCRLHKKRLLWLKIFSLHQTFIHSTEQTYHVTDTEFKSTQQSNNTTPHKKCGKSK